MILRGTRRQRLPVRRIAVSPQISASVKQLLAARLPLLRQPGHLTEAALTLLLENHPPLVYRDNRADQQFYVFGNLRSWELARELPDQKKVLVNVVAKPLQQDIEPLCLCLELLNMTCYGLDERMAPGACLSLHQHLANLENSYLEKLSEKFKRKGAFLSLLGMNRRTSNK